jgi:hypothetical protein
MLIINFMCFFIYVVPLTLVPFVTERNNVNITQTGIILSMYSLG